MITIEHTVKSNNTETAHPSTDVELRLKFVVPTGVRIGGPDGLEQFTLVFIPDVSMVMEPFMYRSVGN